MEQDRSMLLLEGCHTNQQEIKKSKQNTELNDLDEIIFTSDVVSEGLYFVSDVLE
jgi:hypothetical protein